MIDIYKYIFFKSYYLCIRTLNERETPWIFASVISTLVLSMSLAVIFELIYYLNPSSIFDALIGYQGYFALTILFIIVLFVKRNNLYLAILGEVNTFSPKRNRLLHCLSLLYVRLIFLAIFALGYLIRETNLNH